MSGMAGNSLPCKQVDTKREGYSIKQNTILSDRTIAGNAYVGQKPSPQRDSRARFRPHRDGAVLRDDPRRSEEHTSELQSLMRISYAVFCLKKKKTLTT